MAEKREIICISCESEFKIVIHHSDEQLTYCPFCGDELEIDE